MRDFDHLADDIAVAEQLSHGLTTRDGTVTIADDDTPRDVSLTAAGTAPLTDVTVVKNNESWRTVGHDDDPTSFETYTVERTWNDQAPISGLSWDDARGTEADVYYVRLRQANGGMAWAGPLWVEGDS